MADAIFDAGFRGMSRQAQVDKCAKELEAVVISQLFQTMRNTVPDGGLIGKSAADDIFRSMLDGELSRAVADRSPFGLAKALSKELAPALVDAARNAAAPASSGAAPAAPAAAPDPAPASRTPRSWRA